MCDTHEKYMNDKDIKSGTQSTVHYLDYIRDCLIIIYTKNMVL